VKLLDFGLPMRLASRSLRGYMGLQRDTVGKQPSPSPCSVELAMRTHRVDAVNCIHESARAARRVTCTNFPMLLPGLLRHLRRVRRLLLLARHVPRLPRLALGLRLRLQLLLRLTTLWCCGGCHGSSFSVSCQPRGAVWITALLKPTTAVDPYNSTVASSSRVLAVSR
jgi:hypothetical protein